MSVVTAPALPARPLAVATPVGGTRPLWVTWWAIRVAGLAVLTGRLLYPAVDADVFSYGSWSYRLYRGQLPWRDFHVEYPPGALAAMVLPDSNGFRYELEFVVLALCADAAVLALVRRAGVGRIGSWLWVMAPVILGPLIWLRFDIFVALALVGLLACVRAGRWRGAGACLAAATLLKLWPIALLVVLWWVVPAAGRRRLSAWAVGVSLVPTLAVAAYGGTAGLLWMLGYQGHRGIEVETVWALPWLVAHRLGGSFGFGFHHGSTELPVGGAIGLALSAVLPLSLVGASWFVWRRRDRLSSDTAVLLAVAVVLVAGKVLSAQYVVWAVAVVVYAVDSSAASLAARSRVRLVAATVGLAATTQAVYPFGFTGVATGTGSGLVLALAHGAAVVWWVVEVVRAVASSGRGRAADLTW